MCTYILKTEIAMSKCKNTEEYLGVSLTENVAVTVMGFRSPDLRAGKKLTQLQNENARGESIPLGGLLLLPPSSKACIFFFIELRYINDKYDI